MTKYRARIEQYKTFLLSNGETVETPQSVQNFVVELKEMYMASTLWSIFSILKSYFEYEHRLDLGQNLPGVPRLLKQWEKVEETKKSKVLSYFLVLTLFQVFTKAEIEKFLSECPNTIEHIHLKLVVVIGCYGLLRGIEIETLSFEQIKFEGEICFVTVNRKKHGGPVKGSRFAITDPIGVDIVHRYFEFSPESERKGRLLRYFVANKGTQRPIGKNKLGKYPQEVAKFLALDPAGFSGHCWRRTGATILAEADVSVIQLKHAGGWRSDQVCQDYVEESKNEKIKIAYYF